MVSEIHLVLMLDGYRDGGCAEKSLNGRIVYCHTKDFDVFSMSSVIEKYANEESKPTWIFMTREQLNELKE
jgi:hypothetical protein